MTEQTAAATDFQLPHDEIRPFIRIEHTEALKRHLAQSDADAVDFGLVQEFVRFLESSIERGLDAEDQFVAGYTLGADLPLESVKRIFRTAISQGTARDNDFLLGLVARKYPSARKNSGTNIEGLIKKLNNNRNLAYTELVEDAIDRLLEPGKTEIPVQKDINKARTIAHALLKRGEPARIEGARMAQLIARDIVVWSPDDRDAWQIWARGLMREAAYDEAQLLLWDITRRYPDDKWPWYHLVQSILLGDNEQQLAVDVARHAIETLGPKPILRRTLAMGLEAVGGDENLLEALSLFAENMREPKLDGDREAFFRELYAVLGLLTRNEETFSRNAEAIDWQLVFGEKLFVLISEMSKAPELADLAQTVLNSAMASANTVADKSGLGVMQARLLARSTQPDDLADAESLLNTILEQDPHNEQAALALSEILERSDPQSAMEFTRNSYGSRKSAIMLARSVYLAVLIRSKAESPEKLYNAEKKYFSSGDKDERAALAIGEASILSARKNIDILTVGQLIRIIRSSAKFGRLAKTVRGLFDEKISNNFLIDGDENPDLETIESLDVVSARKGATSAELYDWLHYGHKEVPQAPPTPELLAWGAIRKASFIAGYRDTAFEPDLDVTARDPGLADYLEVLSARFHQKNYLESELMGNASLAFEVAVRERDEDALNTLAARLPAYESVALLAKAAIGDREAVTALKHLLSSKEQRSPVENYIFGRLEAENASALGASERIEYLHRSFHQANDMTFESVMAA